MRTHIVPLLSEDDSIGGSDDTEVFAFDDDFACFQVAKSPDANGINSTIMRILEPFLEVSTLVAKATTRSSQNDIYELASFVAQSGLLARVTSTVGGSLYKRKNTFIAALKPPASGHPKTYWIVETSFRGFFWVPNPTPRYAAVLENLPEVMVIPLSHLHEVIGLLAKEVARCFSEKELALPPWRTKESLLSLWDESVVHQAFLSDSCKVGQQNSCPACTRTTGFQPSRLVMKCMPVNCICNCSWRGGILFDQSRLPPLSGAPAA